MNTRAKKYGQVWQKLMIFSDREIPELTKTKQQLKNMAKMLQNFKVQTAKR